MYLQLLGRLYDSDTLLGRWTWHFSYREIVGVWKGFRPSRPYVSAYPTSGLLLDVPLDIVSNLLLESHRPRSWSRQTDRQQGKTSSEMPLYEFASAVATLLTEKLPNHVLWKLMVHTNRLAQGRLALHMGARGLAGDDLERAVKQWEKEHRHTQAACWLVFTEQYRAAIELLMRSKG